MYVILACFFSIRTENNILFVCKMLFENSPNNRQYSVILRKELLITVGGNPANSIYIDSGNHFIYFVSSNHSSITFVLCPSRNYAFISNLYIILYKSQFINS